MRKHEVMENVFVCECWDDDVLVNEGLGVRQYNILIFNFCTLHCWQMNMQFD